VSSRAGQTGFEFGGHACKKPAQIYRVFSRQGFVWLNRLKLPTGAVSINLPKLPVMEIILFAREYTLKARMKKKK
jgi:hypothetical protein